MLVKIFFNENDIDLKISVAALVLAGQNFITQ